MNDTNSNTRPETDRTSVRMWPGITAGLVIGLIAFILSFDALRLVFVSCGINPYLSWGGPVCVDGTILLCTWATWGFKKGHIRGGWYPWAGLVLFSGCSIGGNALHALINNGLELPAWAPATIMSIPPVAMLYATHLIVIIAGDRLDKVNALTSRTLDDTETKTPTEPMTASTAEPLTAPSSAPATPAYETVPPAYEPATVEKPNLRDFAWSAPTPADLAIDDTEADASPKAVEANATADASTTENPALDIQADPRTMPETEHTPTMTEPAAPEPQDEPEPESVSVEPEPESEETAGNIDGPDTITVEPSAETTREGEADPTQGKAADGTDGERTGEREPEPLPAPLAALSRNEARDAAKWLAWADRMHEQGLPLNWQTAQDAGIVSSTSTAKRRLRVYRQAYPDRF
ncbi:DUF2637 domain-containing protein [Bifidobacterium dentium]|uniref:DUF2637 domain-containing protein n=1 Tax=Bifidobacterium dentium TaxID=1689 RepID=UPI0022DFCDD1|nr:DUF2637 domain-containing protein [Bifidobacterium dentium]